MDHFTSSPGAQRDSRPPALFCDEDLSRLRPFSECLARIELDHLALEASAPADLGSSALAGKDLLRVGGPLPHPAA